MRHLREQLSRGEGISGLVRHEERRALVLGAGGSARAVVYALLEDNWDVCVAARRLEQARALASDFQKLSGGANRMSAVELSEAPLGSGLAEGVVRLIVQATPVGMTPHAESSAWPEGLPLPEGAFLYDLVYNPAQTRLVRTAREAGLPAANWHGDADRAGCPGLWTVDGTPAASLGDASGARIW